MNSHSLKERIRSARKHINLSQEELALELGISRSAVAQWEMNGGTTPSVENLIALARRSGFCFEYLSTGRGERIQGEPIAAIAEEPSPYQTLTDQQLRLLKSFDALTTKQRSGLLELLDPVPARPR